MNMITKKEFLQAVTNTVKMISDAPIEAVATDIVCNNGKRGCIQVECGRNASMSVGVDGYYQAFCDGDLSAVTAAAKAVIQAAKNNESQADAMQGVLQEVMDYGQARGMLMCRLVNTGLNRGMLDRGPCIPFHDLSITFYLALDSGKGVTVGITDSLLAQWDISVDELFRDALANMQAKSPAKIQTMFEAMAGVEGVPAEEMERAAKAAGAPTLYVLTNKAKCLGAAVVLYPGILEACAGKMGGDYYLLPSSIHEFLLAPASSMQPDELRAMIQDINQTEVAPEEVLADHAYLYSAVEKKLVMV